MRCVESLLTYFGRAQDVEAKVLPSNLFYSFCGYRHFECCLTFNKTFSLVHQKVVLFVDHLHDSMKIIMEEVQ